MMKDDGENSMVDVYRFLAQAMRYPTPDWFTDQYFSVLLSLLSELQLNVEKDELRKAQKESFDFIEDIQVEHTRLFINAVPHVIAPPYASVHYKGDGTFYGSRIAEATKKFYREKGFSLVKEDDLPDHIVYELEFLALLTQEDEKGEREFLDKFFIPWFSIFMKKVTREAHHPYYRVVMKLIDFFTREGL
ncbi:MAG: molecular chaperone TorD family protein [Pseudomonadota bacterium]